MEGSPKFDVAQALKSLLSRDSSRLFMGGGERSRSCSFRFAKSAQAIETNTLLLGTDVLLGTDLLPSEPWSRMPTSGASKTHFVSQNAPSRLLGDGPL